MKKLSTVYYDTVMGTWWVLNISAYVMNRFYINLIVKVNECVSISSDFYPYFLLSYFLIS